MQTRDRETNYSLPLQLIFWQLHRQKPEIIEEKGVSYAEQKFMP